MDKPMTLLFDPFEAACLALAGSCIFPSSKPAYAWLTAASSTVVTVNYCVADGKSNWVRYSCPSVNIFLTHSTVGGDDPDEYVAKM
jgi:hypothetical protein